MKAFIHDQSNSCVFLHRGHRRHHHQIAYTCLGLVCVVYRELLVIMGPNSDINCNFIMPHHTHKYTALDIILYIIPDSVFIYHLKHLVLWQSLNSKTHQKLEFILEPAIICESLRTGYKLGFLCIMRLCGFGLDVGFG